jgi:hypothetical protein
LVTSLWLPYIDYGKSYRPMVQDLLKALSDQYGCIAIQGVSNPQRVSLQYFGNVVVQKHSNQSAGKCSYLLIQGTTRREEPPATPGKWNKIWEGNRRGDRQERFRLYAKEASYDARATPRMACTDSTSGCDSKSASQDLVPG